MECGTRAGRKGRLLVVEDETLIAEYLVDLLAALGHEVCPPASTGLSALRIADSDRPDLAIVDIGLAGKMDGIETACELRARFGISSIFLSGASNAAVLERANAAGGAGFVQKPFLANEIERAVDQAFENG